MYDRRALRGTHRRRHKASGRNLKRSQIKENLGVEKAWVTQGESSRSSEAYLRGLYVFNVSWQTFQATKKFEAL